MARPNLCVTQAFKIASELFDLGCLGDAREADSYDDRNFVITARLGRADLDTFLLKVHNTCDSEAPEFLEAQNQILQHVALRPDLHSNVPLPSLQGRLMEFINLPGGRRHAVRLLTYIPGQILKYAKQSPALWHDIGGFFARLDVHLAGYQHPAMHRQDDWDLARAPEVIADHLPWTTDPHRRSKLEAAARRFEEVINPVAARLRCSIIHGDGNDANILIDDVTDTVAGILDWGDCIYSYTVNEIAIAAVYAMLLVGSARQLEAGAAVLAGYNEVIPLSDEEWEAIPALMGARMAVSLAMATAAVAAKVPENIEYLMDSHREGWALLDVLLPLGFEELKTRAIG